MLAHQLRRLLKVGHAAYSLNPMIILNFIKLEVFLLNCRVRVIFKTGKVLSLQIFLSL